MEELRETFKNRQEFEFDHKRELFYQAFEGRNQRPADVLHEGNAWFLGEIPYGDKQDNAHVLVLVAVGDLAEEPGVALVQHVGWPLVWALEGLALELALMVELELLTVLEGLAQFSHAFKANSNRCSFLGRELKSQRFLLEHLGLLEIPHPHT